MKVYEMTIRVASAYANIEDMLTDDRLAEAIRKHIADNSADATEEVTDIAVELPVEVRPIFDTDEKNGGEK